MDICTVLLLFCLVICSLQAGRQNIKNLYSSTEFGASRNVFGMLDCLKIISIAISAAVSPWLLICKLVNNNRPQEAGNLSRFLMTWIEIVQLLTEEFQISDQDNENMLTDLWKQNSNSVSKSIYTNWIKKGQFKFFLLFVCFQWNQISTREEGIWFYHCWDTSEKSLLQLNTVCFVSAPRYDEINILQDTRDDGWMLSIPLESQGIQTVTHKSKTTKWCCYLYKNLKAANSNQQNWKVFKHNCRTESEFKSSFCWGSVNMGSRAEEFGPDILSFEKSNWLRAKRDLERRGSRLRSFFGFHSVDVKLAAANGLFAFIVK